MYLLTGTAFLLFGFFQIKPVMHGAVGMAFEISMAVLGAIGLLHWLHEATQEKAEGLSAAPSLLQGQLHQFMTIPAALKVCIVLTALVLPIGIDALIKA